MDIYLKFLVYVHVNANQETMQNYSYLVLRYFSIILTVDTL